MEDVSQMTLGLVVLQERMMTQKGLVRSGMEMGESEVFFKVSGCVVDLQTL